jgi:ribosomal protein S18 acetylase RimI-like enzyme
MEIQLKKTATLSELELIRNLYLIAFPANERRSFEGFQQQFIREEACSIFIVKDLKGTVGFCTLWEFDSFSFIEHMAIFPEVRGKKIGEAVLSLLINKRKSPLLLEAEPPADEISRRRISFYQRNGFHLLDKHYIQPSYDGVTPGPELRLMTTQLHMNHEDLERYTEIIKDNVYRRE